MAEPGAAALDPSALGAEMARLAARLYPICRSITGDGVRETLRILSEVVPLQIVEVPSGTQVLDWTVPPEWNIREAWIADPTGRRVVDMRNSNLHVVSYSVPIRSRMPLAELRTHLYSLPEHPEWIPYRTSYYEESWGFCLAQRQRDSLGEGEYEVCIDSSLGPGSLTYGEFVIPGETNRELLFSAHICHPSLADDNLSAVVVAATLARHFARSKPRHTLRFLFAPGTIGAITWLARNRDHVGRIRGGLTLACLGDAHAFTYKRTIFGSADIDRAVPYALSASGQPHHVIDYFPYGYDERQYNSPGFRLPVGSFMRARDGQFPEYHTSADDLSFISSDRLAEAWFVLASIIEVVDADRRYRSVAPYGEPQLGRRGLYRATGGTKIADAELALFWVLSLSDGEHSVLDIARRARLDFVSVAAAADLLAAHGLLEPI